MSDCSNSDCSISDCINSDGINSDDEMFEGQQFVIFVTFCLDSGR